MIKISLLGMDTVSYNDIDFSDVEALGEVRYAYPKTEDETVEACKGAFAVLVNKTEMTEYVLSRLPDLKYIGAFATGYNNIDLAACKRHGVTFCNAPDYSTHAVAQHTFALLLSFAASLPEYSRSVSEGDWVRSPNFCYYTHPMSELYGKTLGIYGFGHIGKAVAKIGDAMGMNVLFYTRTKTDSPYTQVSEEELFRRSDYLSLHCPLTEETREIVNEKTLSLMQSSAVIVNTARGGLIDEKSLTHALNHDKIRGACLDVIAHEPMREDCPLRHAKHCIITPHVAWAPQNTRQRLERMVAETLRSFLNGTPVHTVVSPPREEQK